MNQYPELSEHTIYRNFNLCPHCELRGMPDLLLRLREGIPMISRSDGDRFHLVLVDGPCPYPAERAAVRTKLVSICFWYSHVDTGNTTLTSVVVLPEIRRHQGSFFRSVEDLADLLTEKLRYLSRLSTLYEFKRDNSKQCLMMRSFPSFLHATNSRISKGHISVPAEGL